MKERGLMVRWSLVLTGIQFSPYILWKVRIALEIKMHQRVLGILHERPNPDGILKMYGVGIESSFGAGRITVENPLLLLSTELKLNSFHSTVSRQFPDREEVLSRRPNFELFFKYWANLHKISKLLGF